MAAEAEENSANFCRTRRDARWQDFCICSAITKLNRGAIQGASVLSPQCITASIRCAAVARIQRNRCVVRGSLRNRGRHYYVRRERQPETTNSVPSPIRL